MRIISFAWGGQSSKALYEEILRLRDENALLQAELDAYELKSIRGVRDLVQTFLGHIEGGTPEETLRDGLEAAVVDMNDHVARLEEHAS